jgi:Zn-dependent protease with chaperone function
MDFFEAQEQARKGTTRLIVLFLLAVVGIVIALNAVAFATVNLTGDDETARQVQQGLEFRWEVHALVTLAALVVIGGSSFFKTAQLHGDGGKVARMLGGRPVDPQTNDPDERKLMNIVEEMSLASGMPVPDVYVMDQDAGINAFAAGSSVEQAVVGVTRGCIAKLSRDELQGVIAHEFSHILNGDMRLNIRLIGVIFGILVIGLIGYTVFRYAPYLMVSNRRSSNDKGGGAALGIAIFVIGGLIWAIGSIGVFFGRLIQANVSRKREYLADASAVQFTRNPNGIRDALRKIGGTAAGAKIDNRHAGECAHLFFASSFSAMFATHPPLPERIKAIDGNWDGTMLAMEDKQRAAPPPRQPRGRQSQRRNPFGINVPIPGIPQIGQLAAGGVAESVGARAAKRVGHLTDETVQLGHDLAESLPTQLVDATRRTDLVSGLVASLFLSEIRPTRLMQEEVLAQHDSQTAAIVDDLAESVDRAGAHARLPLLELAAPRLRTLDAPARQDLLRLSRKLIEADQRIEPFEYALFKILERIALQKRVRERHASLAPLQSHVATMLSAVAAAGHPTEPRLAKKAYRAGVEAAGLELPDYNGSFTLASLDQALEELAATRMASKRRVVEAAAATVLADGKVRVEEAELLRAVSAVLGCPMPPIPIATK